jgi:hypothetical protein
VIRLRGSIEYLDGRVETFETGSAALAEWELYALRHGYPLGDKAPPMLSSLVVAHAALKIQVGFDPWRETVAGVELDADGVPPTLPAPSLER